MLRNPARRLLLIVMIACATAAGCRPLPVSPPNDAPAPAPAPAAIQAPPAAVAAPTSGVVLNEAEHESLRLLNALRTGQGLGTVVAAADMTDFARTWAAEMSATGFRHSSSADRSHLFTGGRTSLGENIAWWSATGATPAEAAAKLHDLWVTSPGHYGNMIGDWTELGVGFHHDANGWHGVHVFANG